MSSAVAQALAQARAWQPPARLARRATCSPSYPSPRTGSAEVWLTLGDLHRQLGDRRDAGEAYRKALLLGEAAELVAQRLAALEPGGVIPPAGTPATGAPATHPPRLLAAPSLDTRLLGERGRQLLTAGAQTRIVVTVNPEGGPADPVIYQSGGKPLDELCRELVPHFRFAPAEQDGPALSMVVRGVGPRAEDNRMEVLPFER